MKEPACIDCNGESGAPASACPLCGKVICQNCAEREGESCCDREVTAVACRECGYAAEDCKCGKCEHGSPVDDCARCDEDRADDEAARLRQKRICDCEAADDAAYDQMKDERNRR